MSFLDKENATLKRIVDDPLASEEDLLCLAKFAPRVAVGHPNCTPLLWWALASKYPLEAQSSVLFDLMTLESPGQWERTEAANRGTHIAAHLERLPPATRERFAIECLERMLTSFDQEYPFLHAVLRVRKRLAVGEASEEEMKTAHESAEKAYNREGPESLLRGTRALGDLDAVTATTNACSAIAYSKYLMPLASADMLGCKSYSEAWNLERKWQLKQAKTLYWSATNPTAQR